MLTIEVVKCSDYTHKAQCLSQVLRAVEVARKTDCQRNGRKVTVRGEITDPCACHLDALLWYTLHLIESHDQPIDGMFYAECEVDSMAARREMH